MNETLFRVPSESANCRAGRGTRLRPSRGLRELARALAGRVWFRRGELWRVRGWMVSVQTEPAPSRTAESLAGRSETEGGEAGRVQKHARRPETLRQLREAAHALRGNARVHMSHISVTRFRRHRGAGRVPWPSPCRWSAGRGRLLFPMAAGKICETRRRTSLTRPLSHACGAHVDSKCEARRSLGVSRAFNPPVLQGLGLRCVRPGRRPRGEGRGGSPGGDRGRRRPLCVGGAVRHPQGADAWRT